MDSGKLTRLLVRYRLRLLTDLLEESCTDSDIRVLDDGDLEEFEVDVLRAEIHHRYLPMLEEVGVIEWDRSTRTVRRGPEFDQIRPFIEPRREH